jgi:diguanylate cyclase (GGDEF)-like protein/PAS domain S-box-containing protein
MLANTIQSIMITNVISSQIGTTVRKAVSLMSEKNISCLIITNSDHKPVGIITERDVLRIAAQNNDVASLKVEDVMTTPVKTVSKSMDIYGAAIYLEDNRLRRIVVAGEDGRLLGLLTQTDLKNHLGAVYYVKLKNIDHIMTRNVVTAEDDENLLTVIQRMNTNNVSCLVIGKQNEPIGIITERDVTHLLADRNNLTGLTASEFIKSSIISISRNTSVYEASKLMSKNGIRRLVVTDENNNILGIVTESDIVKQLEKDYVEALRGIVERDRTYIDKVKECIFECSPNIEGIFTWINQVGASLLGYKSPQRLIGKKLKTIFYMQQDLNDLFNQLEKKGIVKDFCVKLKKPNGRSIYAEGTFYFVKDDDGKICCIEGVLRDITERKRMEDKIKKYSLKLEEKVKERTAKIRQQNKELEKINAKLHELSICDGLTGIKNFRYFYQILEAEFKRAKRYQLPLSCIILDIDDFKFINDGFGHPIGDYALIRTSRLLKKLVRETDIVARYGGDEFTIILPNTGFEDACTVGNKILKRFRNFYLKKNSLRLGKISLSIGISSIPHQNIKTARQLMELADKAMYHAKESGKNNMCVSLSESTLPE